MDLCKLHSFGIITYKDSPYLESCIQSILKQTVKSSLYISTSTPSDYIREISDKYGIRLCVHQGETDISSDWNFAVGMCDTPFLTLAHQDDVYYPCYAEKLYHALQTAGDGLIAFCDYEEIAGDKIRSDTRLLKVKRALLWPYVFKRKLKSSFAKKSILRFGSPICCPSVMYNLKRCRPDFSAEYKNDLDWDAWLRLAGEKGSFVYVRDRLLSHRIHGDSETTRQISCQGRYDEDLKIFLRLWPKPVAKCIARLYRYSYVSNKI